MRTPLLVTVSLLAALAFVPSASAGCLVTAGPFCVHDPGTDPCGSVLSCDLCFATVDLCIHLEACLAGDLHACIDAQWYCLHSWCPPPYA